MRETSVLRVIPVSGSRVRLEGKKTRGLAFKHNKTTMTELRIDLLEKSGSKILLWWRKAANILTTLQKTEKKSRNTRSTRP